MLAQFTDQAKILLTIHFLYKRNRLEQLIGASVKVQEMKNNFRKVPRSNVY
jgi:hypothetical protein